MPAVTMTLGSYNFVPVPLLDISKEYRKMGDGSILSVVNRLTLNGTLVESENNGGLTGVISKQDALSLAFSGAAINPTGFGVACGGMVLISGVPRINSLSFSKSSDNWTMTSAYTAELEWTEYTKFTGVDVTDVTDNWSLEINSDKNYYQIMGIMSQGSIANLTRNISAKGIATTGTPGYIVAKNFINQYLLGDTAATYRATGMFVNFDVLNANPVNHIRSSSYNMYDGSYNLNETWILLPSGSYKASEEISATKKTSIENPLTMVSVEGTIQGYETRDYTTQPFGISQSKIAAAESYFQSMENTIYSRATGLTGATGLNQIALNTSRGYNASNGVITYNYEFDDRPANVVVGSVFEAYNVGGTNPVDVFASIPVLGRPQGPVLQALSTKTVKTKEASVEVIMSRAYLNNPNYSGIADAVVTGILRPLQATISGLYSQVFISSDTENWNPKSCKYTRNVTWTVQDCNDTASPML